MARAITQRELRNSIGEIMRAVDPLIAATALAAELPLYTRNPDDFAGLTDVEVVAV